MHASQWAVNLIGYVAALATTFSFVPQLLRVLRLKSAREVSMGMFLIFSAGVFLWFVYGVSVRSWPIVLANAVTLGLSVSILVLKIRYDRAALS